MPQSFPYIVNDKTERLIIGSMPGIASLNAAEYYAHKSNLFWKILYECYHQSYLNPTYKEKIDFLLSHHLGLWDSAYYCEREGSLDSHIKNVIPNDFSNLFLTYPHIRYLLFNGQKAFHIFKQLLPQLLSEKEYIVLPSTSPANASINYKTKLMMWNIALKK